MHKKNKFRKIIPNKFFCSIFYIWVDKRKIHVIIKNCQQEMLILMWEYTGSRFTMPISGNFSK